MIISGLLLLALSNYIINELIRIQKAVGLKEKYLTYYRVAFVVAPIALCCIGIFPYGYSFFRNFLHGVCAYSAFGVYGFIIASLYYSMSSLPKYFLRINYLFLMALIAGYILFKVGYFTLAVNEIFSFGIVSAWLILFLRNIASIDSREKLEEATN